MTALAAIWSDDGALEADRSCFSMLCALARLGTENPAVEAAGDVALGRDLRPLLPEDRIGASVVTGGGGALILAADVRLDNRPELIGALGLEERRSDASLVMAAWERWGEGALDRIIGDWAFVMFDRDARRLTLARDPLGGRPLFWSRQRRFFAAASLPRGIHALGVERRPDPVRVARLAGQLPSRDARSFFAGIQRVPPGHFLRVGRGGEELVRHWRPRLGRTRFPSFGETVEAYRAQLDGAVAARLRGAGPTVGAHLSGGWDSGAVTATAARVRSPFEPVLAFTAGPRDASAAPHARFSDEAAHAATVAALYANIDHVVIRTPATSPIAALDDDLALYDRPMVNLCNHVWLRAIREAARERRVQVMLTGEIGNFTISSAPATLLAGFVARGQWGRWAREAIGAWRSGRGRVRGIMASSFGPWVPETLWQILQPLARLPAGFSSSLLHPEQRRLLADDIAAAGRETRPHDFVADTLHALADLDFSEYRKGVLSGWGIDKRDATGDVRIVEFMLSLPPEMFLNHGRRRPLARAALADRLPPAVLDEPRKGYQAADWHVGLSADLDNVRALVERIARDPLAESVLDAPAMRALVDAWPNEGWARPETVARYRRALLTALSAGHFLVSA